LFDELSPFNINKNMRTTNHTNGGTTIAREAAFKARNQMHRKTTK
jgi:hypothetical protein